MKLENHSGKVENYSCDGTQNALFAASRRVGGEVTQRIANPSSPFKATALKTLENALSAKVEKTTGHFANQDGTLKALPSGWWLLPAIFSGAAVWLCAARAVGWV